MENVPNFQKIINKSKSSVMIYMATIHTCNHVKCTGLKYQKLFIMVTEEALRIILRHLFQFGS